MLRVFMYTHARACAIFTAYKWLDSSSKNASCRILLKFPPHCPVRFVWLQGGCPALCSGVLCFTLAFLKVTLQQNRNTEIYVSLLFTGTS